MSFLNFIRDKFPLSNNLSTALYFESILVVTLPYLAMGVMKPAKFCSSRVYWISFQIQNFLDFAWPQPLKFSNSDRPLYYRRNLAKIFIWISVSISLPFSNAFGNISSSIIKRKKAWDNKTLKFLIAYTRTNRNKLYRCSQLFNNTLFQIS